MERSKSKLCTWLTNRLCCNNTYYLAVHPYCRGAAGPAHSDDYRIASVEKACLNSVKVQLVLLELLLQDGAAEAQRIVDNYTPVYDSVEAYLKDLDRLMIDKEAVEYGADGTVVLR